MERRSVVLTGATGFVGKHVLLEFLKNKFVVHVLGRTAPVLKHTNLHFHSIDLLDDSSSNNLVEIFSKIKPTTLLHLAWYVTPGKFWTSTENVTWVYKSFELLRIFNEHGGQRATFIGSCAEYSWEENEICNEKTTALLPSTLYGQAKKSLFELATKYAEDNKLSFSWARLFFMFGEGEPKEKLVGSVINSLNNDEKVTCKNPGLIRDYMYVKEIAKALAMLLGSDVQGPINIATGKQTVIGELMQSIGTLLGKPSLIEETIASISNQPLYIVANVNRLREEVGYFKNSSTEEDLRKYIDNL